MSIGKHLTWILPVAVVGGIGIGATTDISGLLASGGDTTAQPQARSAETESVLAALEAVTAAAEAPAAPTAADSSQQLAVLLAPPAPQPAAEPVAEPVAQDVEVTRSQGFATDTLAGTSEEAAQVTPEAPSEIGADFFSAAQANLAQANSCASDLRNMATQAKVYFPSGALTGDASGIGQARLIGTIAARCPGVTIEVQGHSDPSGDPAVNRRLSQERAEAVIARIAASGIDTSKFVAVGLGSARPSGVTGTQPDAFYDRRVEFAVLDSVQNASFTAPAFGTTDFTQVACVIQLQQAADATTIAYSPGSVIVSQDDLNAAIALARLANDCPQARLRVMGHHADEYGTVEDAGTARLRAVALMTSLVGAGYPSEQIIIGAPSDTRPMEGRSNSRVDFDVILEEL